MNVGALQVHPEAEWVVPGLSLVRKNRNSSGGLYRCRRRSAYDRRRTNALRFLMKTLLARPASRLIHAFPAKPSMDTLGSRRCLRVPCQAPLSPSEVAGVSQLQLSIFWRQFNPAFQSCWHGNLRIQNRSLPSSRPLRARYFSHTLGHVRGRLRPTTDQGSQSGYINGQAAKTS